MPIPIILAAQQKQSRKLRQLILAGADPDTRDPQGETALTWAAHLGHTPIVKDLLAGGADQDVVGNRFRASPLVLAARGGYRGIVSLLVVLSDLDVADPEGNTALIWAVRGGHVAIARILKDAGADPAPRNQSDQNAFELAIALGDEEMIGILRA